MALERIDIISIAGLPATVVGPDIQLGQTAPEFAAHAQDWSTFEGLITTKGKVRIIGSLPSVNTSVCDRETRYFNQAAADLSDDIVILTLSMDLPYTLKNYCAAAGVDKVVTLSDHKNAEFGEKYGVLLKERRILRRAIFVVDRDDKVVYVDYMRSLGDEPDYDAVLTAARQALISNQ